MAVTGRKREKEERKRGEGGKDGLAGGEDGGAESEGWSGRGDLTDRKQERGDGDGGYLRHPLSSYM